MTLIKQRQHYTN